LVRTAYLSQPPQVWGSSLIFNVRTTSVIGFAEIPFLKLVGSASQLIAHFHSSSSISTYSKMSSCCGSRKKHHKSNGEIEPLLPVYEDDTSLQRRVHQKLHTYQMIRALSKGFMPSTEQVVINLRTLLASDFLNPDTPGLSSSGRRLVQLSKRWLSEFIEFLIVKNDQDQIQDFIWFLIHARISVDADDLIQTATSTRAKADASASKFIMYIGIRLLTVNSI